MLTKEDELGQGSGGGGSVSESHLGDNIQSETLVKNMSVENQVDEPCEEGDDDEEIMVEIVGSDVFVDGVGGNEEGEFVPKEIGDFKKKEEEMETISEAVNISSKGGGNKLGESDLGLSELRDEKIHIITETIDVSVERGQNKNGATDLDLPESRDEENYIVTEATDVSGGGRENIMGGSELELLKSRDQNIPVVTEAMDVSGEGGENEREESELGQPETRDGESYVVTEPMYVLSDGGENKIRGSEAVLPEMRHEKNHVVPEAMDVPSEGVENKMGEIEAGLPKSIDEKYNVSTGENKVGESEFRLPVSTDGKNNVNNGENKFAESELGPPELMDVTDNVIPRKNKIGESELRLPESRDETNNVITGENKTGESELGLHESGDETNIVVPCKNKTGEIELRLLESRDENNNALTAENKLRESELRLPESTDDKSNVVAGENKLGESELGLLGSRDEKNVVVTEAMDVSCEDKIQESELYLGLSNSRGESNQVVTEVIDGSFSEPGNVEVGTLLVQTEEVTTLTQVVNNEEDMIEGEAVDEKTDIAEKEKDALLLSDDTSNQDRLGSDSVISDGVAKDLYDGLSVNAQVHVIDSAIVTTQTTFCEEKRINDEAVDEKKEILPLSDDALNEDQPCSDSGVTKDSYDEELGNGEGSQNVRVDSVVKEVDLVNAEDGDHDKAAKFVDEEVSFTFAAGSEGLIVTDSNCTNFEELDVPKDVIDGESNINLPDLSSVGIDESLKSNEDLETNIYDQNHAVSDEPTQPDNEFDIDVVNKDEIHGIVEEIVSEESKQSLESRESAEIPNDVEICCLPEIKEQEGICVTVILNETSGHAVGELKSIDLSPSDAAASDDTEKMEMPLDSNIYFFDAGKIDEKNDSEKNNHNAMEVDSQLGNKEISPEDEQSTFSDEERTELESSLKSKQLGYFLPPENGAHFAVSDLVWGKVRSHPWWPGQIFDPADASEEAVKYHKKDSYLVAYFGDQTFAWNESSLLKPFGPYFSQIVKQSNSEAFQNAVDSALEEVSRRVELVLACSCIPRDKYTTIEAQLMENAGIREESSKRYGLDHSTRASSFEPNKLIQFVRDLAPCAFPGPDRLDLVIARAQLLAFYRFKNYRPLIEFTLPSELLEMDDEKIQSDEIIIASHKRKHAPKDGSELRKESSMMETGPSGEEYFLDAEDESLGKKWKALDPSGGGYDKRVSIYASKLSKLTSQTSSKPSFKIGECIRRVASQLTGSASLGKDEMVIDGSLHLPERREGKGLSIESFSVEEMLLQLERVVREPKKRHDFLNVIHAFFMGFRSSVVLNRRGRKKRPEQATAGGPAEEFEFDDDVNDSYWKDRIMQNYSDEQLLLSNCEKGLGTFQLAPYGAEKHVKPGRKPNSRRRFSDSVIVNEVDKQVKRRKQESSPAELILSFSERNIIPSEINLNKMYRRFGALMESETEVDHESGCAKVIFKRGSDAEVARSSSEAFNVFGPVPVNYHIGYEPLISVRVLPISLPLPQEDVTLMQ